MSIEISTLLNKLVARQSLTPEESEAVFGRVIRGELSPALVGGLLVGLATKGESVDEILGAVSALRAHAVPLTIQALDAVDTCGTGGDAKHTFNVSTAAALIASAAGVPVAKHGNRAMSGLIGAADVLEAAGVRIDLTPEQVARCIDQTGVGFAFAPTFHPAMRHAAPIRRELGIRTIFNLLGPLANPAGVRRQVVGVFSDRWLEPLAEVLQRLGSIHVMVVHGSDGVDEISLSAETHVAELRDGAIRRYQLMPEDLGFPRQELAAIRISSLEEAVASLLGVIEGRPGPLLDIALLNAGAAIHVGGRTPDLRQGVDAARGAVESGAARRQLERLIEVSRQ